MPEGKMTLDALAQMIARGFEETATKKGLERLNVKVDNLETKVDNLDMKISADVSRWEQDFSGLRKWVGELDQRIRKIEHKAP